jgi:phospholipid transport system substrate-binding protein
LNGLAWANDNIELAIRAATAEEAIELATVELLEIIQSGQEYAEADPERFYTEVEGLLRPLVDFSRFARNVMGPYYKTADDEQRQRFVDSFKWSLVRTYALALTEFRDGEIDVLAPRRPPSNPDKANVTMEIKYEGKTYVVVYRMRRSKEQTWRLQNMVVEGVNLGLNFKSQFSAAMKDPQNKGDLDVVIESWGQSIEQDELADESTPPTTSS